MNLFGLVNSAVHLKFMPFEEIGAENCDNQLINILTSASTVELAACS